jgi:hypothetical protein
MAPSRAARRGMKERRFSAAKWNEVMRLTGVADIPPIDTVLVWAVPALCHYQRNVLSCAKAALALLFEPEYITVRQHNGIKYYSPRLFLILILEDPDW